jgi:hypothetical protein
MFCGSYRGRLCAGGLDLGRFAAAEGLRGARFIPRAQASGAHYGVIATDQKR